MKRVIMLAGIVVCLSLLCGSAPAWETEGKLKEWDVSPFRPYDIEVLHNGSAWLTYHEGTNAEGRLLEFRTFSGAAIDRLIYYPAKFQTLDSAPDNTLWIADGLDQIAHYDPDLPPVSIYPLDPAVFNLPAEPFGVTVAPDGSVWFTCWQDLCLGRLDPGTGTFERFAPMPAGVLPATPVEIAFDPDGNAWFTMRGPVGTPGLGKYDPVADDFTMWFDPDFISPFGIIRSGSGLWFLDHHANLLVRFDRFSYTMEKFTVPAHLSDPHFLVADPEGVIWFTSFASGAIGTYNSWVHEFDHVPLQDPNAHPMGIGMSRNGWICWAESFEPEHGGVGLFNLDPKTAFFSSRTPVSHPPVYITDGDVGAIDLSKEDLTLYINGEPKNIYELNAFDKGYNPETGVRRHVLSLRKDSLLYSPVSGFVYVKKNDLLAIEPITGAFEVIFKGADFKVPGIDAVSVLDDGTILFSPDGSFYYQSPLWGSHYYHEEDLLMYFPDANDLYPYLSGSMLGITSLDAVEHYGGTLYFSVKDPVYINLGAKPFYLEDGDIAGLDVSTGEFELKFKGALLNIYDMDAISLSPTRFYHAQASSRSPDEPLLGK